MFEAGYSTKAAVKSLNEKSINSIESFVNKHPVRFQKLLEGTKYENAGEFEFLPGHTAILLSLPEYINEFDKNNTSKKTTGSQKRKFSEIEDLPRRSNDEHMSADATADTSADVNETESEQLQLDLQSVEFIREKLIKKINDFAKSKRIRADVTQSSIKDFRAEGDSGFKCSVQCSFCNRKIPCSYKPSHWTCGNFESHLKTHFTFEVLEVRPNNQLQAISSRQSNSKITKVGNINEINEFLKD